MKSKTENIFRTIACVSPFRLSRALDRETGERKRPVLKHSFNLVEVTLAIAVLAVGLASVFVLFPVGLRANRNATAENNIANAAEYVMGFVRAQCQAGATDSSSKDGRFSSALGTVFCPESTTVAGAVNVDEPGSSWSAVNANSGFSADRANILQYSTPGIFLIRQISGPDDEPIVEFSAIARVYLDQDGASGFDTVYFPAADLSKSGEKAQLTYQSLKSAYSKLSIEYFLLPAVLELSWPATVPEAQREKRIFRFEIFNDQFVQNNGE